MKRKKTNKSPFIILIVLIIAIFGALHFFGNYFEKGKTDNQTEDPVVELKKEQNFSVTLAGNVLVNSNMWTDTRTQDGYDFSKIFENVNDIMKKSDINFYFQQSIVGGADLGSSLYYKYNSPVELLDTVSSIGFNVASLASYHSFDKGIDGITNTIENMKSKKINYSGIRSSDSDSKNAIINQKDAKIGLLSYTLKTDEVLTEEYAVNIYTDEAAKKDIDLIKDKVDFIIVSIDWSGVNSVEITEEQKRIANYLSTLGVNVVVGNSSYSIQPIEKINDTLVCYSLGNLLSGHTLIDSRISAMVDFDVKIDNGKVSIDDINVSLYYAYNLNGTRYKILPFAKITNELANFSTYYDKYKELISTDTAKINFYNIGE